MKLFSFHFPELHSFQTFPQRIKKCPDHFNMWPYHTNSVKKNDRGGSKVGWWRGNDNYIKYKTFNIWFCPSSGRWCASGINMEVVATLSGKFTKFVLGVSMIFVFVFALEFVPHYRYVLQACVPLFVSQQCDHWKSELIDRFFRLQPFVSISQNMYLFFRWWFSFGFGSSSFLSSPQVCLNTNQSSFLIYNCTDRCFCLS